MKPRRPLQLVVGTPATQPSQPKRLTTLGRRQLVTAAGAGTWGFAAPAPRPDQAPPAADLREYRAV